jgi:hypothetical protein
VINAPAPAPAPIFLPTIAEAAPINIVNNNVNNNVNTNTVAPAYTAPTYVVPTPVYTPAPTQVFTPSPKPLKCSIKATASAGANSKVILSWVTEQGDATKVYCNHGILAEQNLGAVSSKAVYPWQSTTCYAVVTKSTTGAQTSCSVYVPVEKPKPTYIAPIKPVYVAPVKPVVTLASTVIPQYEYKSVVLNNVPYTGAEDYIYPMFLLALMLTAGYAGKNMVSRRLLA